MLIREAIEDFELNQVVLSRAEKYINKCMYILERFERYMKEEFDIAHVEDVKPVHIRNLIKYWQELGNERNSTLNNNLATIKVFYKYLGEEEYVDLDKLPTRNIRNLKEEKTVITTFNDTEVKAIIRDCSGNTYFNIRDKLMLLILFDCGLRVSELTALKPDDIGDHSIRVRGKGSKERILYISPIVKRQMNRYDKAKAHYFRNKETLSDAYFLNQEGQPTYRSTVNKILKQHCKNVKVRQEVRCSPHDCRHFFAHTQLRNGLDVYSLSRLLGHYDTSITTVYLKGLSDEVIVKRGAVTSPLMNINKRSQQRGYKNNNVF